MKRALIDAAAEELTRKGVSFSASKLSVMTGVHRMDVARLQDTSVGAKETPNQLVRIIGRWQTDRRFTTQSGNARTLTVEGANSEFVQLVRAVSKDLNPYTILFELERTEAVTRTSQGLRLQARAYISSKDIETGFQMLGQDYQDLISSVEANVLHPSETPNLHLKTEYDRIPAERAAELRD